MAFLRSFEVCSSNIRETSRDPSANSRNENVRQIFDRDAFLFHRIAFAQGDGFAERGVFFAKRFEIDRNAERSSDFVLATIPTADRTALIVKSKHVRPKKIDNLLRFGHELFVIFQQWKNAALNGRDP